MEDQTIITMVSDICTTVVTVAIVIVFFKK